ncbi:MAG: sigma 54-interacting transcriptional regulator [Clostridiales Family XIII bacterium]|jgi:TyrR family helix-turn-helix protein/PAS domain S-box-containing protein|nr:sigma 54-interacting transcriptional regulator [Clostridiales Family XIII bacterium]
MSDYYDTENVPLSKAELLRVLDTVDDAVFVDDAAGNTLWINTACESLFEIEREKVVGVNVDDLEKDGIFTSSVAKMVIETGLHSDLVHQNKSGKRILSTGVPVADENGGIHFIITTSRDITELAELESKLEAARDALKELAGDSGFAAADVIAISPAMRDVMKLVKRLTELDSTVLITGESGVGKGVIAEVLHRYSARRGRPFVRINCGAIPENLIETELFGYEGGAFTGGRKEGKPGLFEIADGGSLFLDEISELPLKLQVKLLQVIQEREIVRVGGVKPIKVDVRIVSASNKDLYTEVIAGRFREDLYYRLNVVPIYIPPLRERKEDLAPFIASFLEKYNAQMGESKRMSADALALLSEYAWPGNVRELQNIVERLIITTRGTFIQPEDLPGFIRESRGAPFLRASSNGGGIMSASGIYIEGMSAGGFSPETDSLKNAVDAYESAILQNAKARFGSTRAIAKALGVTQPTIVRKMQKYGIEARG